MKTINGWIKLHRKILSNEKLFNSKSKFGLFVYLLLIADENGKLTTGRKQLAKLFRTPESTIYKDLKGYEKVGLINIESNNQFSAISIINWSKFQSKVTPKVAIKEQQSNNKVTHYKNIRIENKEYKHIYIAGEVSDEDCNGIAEKYNISLKDVFHKRDAMETWSITNLNKKTDWKLTLMGWIREDINDGKIKKIPAPQPIREIDHKKASAGLEKLSKLREQFKIGEN